MSTFDITIHTLNSIAVRTEWLFTVLRQPSNSKSKIWTSADHQIHEAAYGGAIWHITRKDLGIARIPVGLEDCIIGVAVRFESDV